MVRKEIKYIDFDGTEKKWIGYFNLSRTECIDIDLEYEDEGGLMEHLKNILPLLKQEENAKKKPLVDFVKMMVERSYGVRPKSDPNLFIKEDENGRRVFYKFKASPAYDEFVFNLMTGKESLNDFMEKILPKIPDADRKAAMKKMKEEGFDFGEEYDASATEITRI